MAASHEMVAPDLNTIRSIVAITPKSCEVMESTITNKKLVLVCINPLVAKKVAFRINDAGFACEIRKGLKSNKHYIQAHF